jgi:hypothetical protein
MRSRRIVIAAFSFASAAAVRATDDRPLPTFKFDPPVGFLGGGDSFRPNSMHQASIHIVYFRPFAGTLEREIEGPLSAEWARELGREVRLVGRSERTPISVRGADAACITRIQEDYWGTPYLHTQLAVAKAGSVGVVYVSTSQDALERYHGEIATFMGSLHVQVEGPPPPVAAEARPRMAALAGLYLGQGMNLRLDGAYIPGTRFYLFSADGRVHRGSGLPKAPNGDIERFDCRRAREQDPANCGTYEISGGRTVIRLGGQNPIVVEPAGKDRLRIDGIVYQKQQLSR